MKLRTDLSVLPKYIYAVALTLLSAFAVFTALVFNQGNKIIDFEKQISAYHLATIANLNNLLFESEVILTEIGLDLQVSNQGEAENGQAGLDGARAVFSGHLYVLASNMDKIIIEQKSFSVPLFYLPLERLKMRFEEVKSILLKHSDLLLTHDSVRLIRDAINQFQRTTEQLRRLHLHEAELVSARLSKQDQFNRRDVWIFATVIVLIVTIIIGRIMTLIRVGIREHQQMHKELQQYRDHLEDSVQKRTIELRAINTELESYSYSIAHDLRTPLRAITSFSQIVLDDAGERLDDDEKNYMNRVIAAGLQMSKLIDDILELSRISRFDMVYEQVNLSMLAYEISQELHGYAPDRKVDFLIQKGLMLNCSPLLIELLLRNLIGNAWKFTQKISDAKIEVGKIYDNGKGIFFVRDNGVGFDAKYSEKVFAPFHRLHRPNEYEGTGVGLAIVQSVIRRHHGEVWADSILGKGTTVYFTLPDADLDTSVVQGKLAG